LTHTIVNGLPERKRKSALKGRFARNRVRAPDCSSGTHPCGALFFLTHCLLTH